MLRTLDNARVEVVPDDNTVCRINDVNIKEMLWFLFLFTQTLFMDFLDEIILSIERERERETVQLPDAEESWANTALGNIRLQHTECV